MAVENSGCDQWAVIIDGPDIGDVQGKEPGQAGTDAEGDNGADDEQETDDVVVVQRTTPGRPFSGFVAGLPGWHEEVPVKVKVYGCGREALVVY